MEPRVCGPFRRNLPATPAVSGDLPWLPTREDSDRTKQDGGRLAVSPRLVITAAAGVLYDRSSSTAWAAARRAIGTRNGEQET